MSCSSGNLELDPEESDIWNIGFTFRPIGDLEISLDYQEIEYADRIVRLGTEDTLRRDLATMLLVNGLTQDEYEALDAADAAALRADWYAGSSDPNATGSVLQVVRDVAVMNVNVIDFRVNIVPPIPEYRTNLRLNWLKNNQSVGITKRLSRCRFWGGWRRVCRAL